MLQKCAPRRYGLCRLLFQRYTLLLLPLLVQIACPNFGGNAWIDDLTAITETVGKEFMLTVQATCMNGTCCFEEGAPITGVKLDDVAMIHCRTCGNDTGGPGSGTSRSEGMGGAGN